MTSEQIAHAVDGAAERHARCEAVLATVPGIGPLLAHRIHQRLDVHTLEQLDAAAHDGRLARVPGFGARRLLGVREILAGLLGRHRPASPPPHPAPPVSEVLDVDREYRDKAACGLLVRIAPRRFNPKREAWLPVLRTARGGRSYTALFSNTVRAHELGKTDDWVVLYIDDGRAEREATVVTETHGPLAGRRVLRGREDACAAYYAACDANPPAAVRDSAADGSPRAAIPEPGRATVVTSCRRPSQAADDRGSNHQREEAP